MSPKRLPAGGAPGRGSPPLPPGSDAEGETLFFGTKYRAAGSTRSVRYAYRQAPQEPAYWRKKSLNDETPFQSPDPCASPSRLPVPSHIQLENHHVALSPSRTASMAVYETPSENADQPEPLGRDGDARSVGNKRPT